MDPYKKMVYYASSVFYHGYYGTFKLGSFDDQGGTTKQRPAKYLLTSPSYLPFSLFIFNTLQSKRFFP